MGTENSQLVIFALGEEEFALPIAKVQEINQLIPITKLPQARNFVEGIISLRGRIIPVLNLRKRLLLPQTEHNEEARIIVLEVLGHTVGIIVDAVHEVLSLQEDALEEPPPACALDTQFVQAVGRIDERLIMLLEIDKLLLAKDEVRLQTAKNQQQALGLGQELAKLCAEQSKAVSKQETAK